MRSLCSCCLDCLEDVHSSFNFDPLNFSHTSDEHTTARHTVTERGMSKTDRGRESVASVHTHIHIHMSAFTHTHIHTCIRNCSHKCMIARTNIHTFTDSLAHDHQRCLDLLLLLLHFPHHLQHGVSWRTALPWPGEEVEQGHLKGRLRALQTTDSEEEQVQAYWTF